MSNRTFSSVLVAILALGLIGGVVVEPRLSTSVPTHWNWRGTPDGFSGRFTGAFGLPLFNVGLAALLLVIARFGPMHANVLRSRRAVQVQILASTAFLLALQVVMWCNLIGWHMPIVRAALVLGGVTVMVAGNYLGKMRRNPYFGIRTPWTMASEEVWERTHRAGGPLFVAWGLSWIAAALLLPMRWQPWVTLSVLGLVTVWCFGFSWWCARHPSQASAQ